MIKKYVFLIYLRVSSEDGDKAESDSIDNQRKLLRYYISEKFSKDNIEIIEIVDDGYTGTNMQRPGMRKLLVLAETQQIDCVIVKDFSRFSRDYVDFGTYVEKQFPAWNMRFISVNDDYDSADYNGITGGVDMAFKSIAYAMYSRDLSEKSKSAIRILNKNGKFTGTYALYGYMKSPEDKRKLIIDPIAAKNVQRMFELKVSGLTPAEIAVIYNKERIPTPSAYKKMQDEKSRDWSNETGYSQWTSSKVAYMLSNEQYMGKLISGRSESVAVGSGKKRVVEKDKHIVVNDAFEAIISPELFEAAQSEPKIRRKTVKANHLFQGILKCSGCGHSMNAYDVRGDKTKYYCSYKKYNTDKTCVCDNIYEHDLIDVIYNIIEAELQRVIDIQRVQEDINIRLKRNEHKINNIVSLINAEKKKKMDDYIRLTKGEITEDEFVDRRKIIDGNISKYSETEKELQGEALKKEDLTAMDLFGKYINAEELNRDMLKDLIKSIYVYNDNRIEVEWNFKEKII